MPTTINENTFGEFIRGLTACLLLLVGITASRAQSHHQNDGNTRDFTKDEVAAFAYTFKINGVTNRASAKDFAEIARGLFDGIPEFDEKTGWFTSHTSYALDEGDVRLKIEWMGYELNQFKAIEIRE